MSLCNNIEGFEAGSIRSHPMSTDMIGPRTFFKVFNAVGLPKLLQAEPTLLVVRPSM